MLFDFEADNEVSTKEKVEELLQEDTSDGYFKHENWG